MLNLQTFTLGIGTIISVIGDKANHIKNKSAIDILYNQLSDLDQDSFLPGISLMIKEEDIKFFPSVYTIRKYVNRINQFGYSFEELLDLAKSRELTQKPYSNILFDNFISNVNIELSIKSNKLELKGQKNNVSAYKQLN